MGGCQLSTSQAPVWSAKDAANLSHTIVHNVEQVLQGKHLQVEQALAAVMAGGHV